MENKMQSFTSDKFGTIRIVEEDGKALFRATDVAKSLGYGNPHEALYRHCKYLVKREVPNPQSVNGKMVEALFIPEGDLYRLITHSKLPEAQAFESWVFDEVLPSIRRHGGYIDGQDKMTDDELIARALVMVKSKLDEREKQLQEQRPMVEFAHHVADSPDTISVGVMAKLAQDNHINIGRTRLFDWLRRNHILSSENVPYQQYISAGYFQVVERIVRGQNGVRIIPVTRVTGKGQIYLINRLREDMALAK